MLKIATFNLENLFTRSTAMNPPSDEDGRKAIEDHAKVSAIVDKRNYSATDEPANAPLEVVANAPRDWTGYFELKRDNITDAFTICPRRWGSK